MRLKRSVPVVAVCALFVLFAVFTASPLTASAASAYSRSPSKGDSVRFDGSVGGETFGWGFYNEYWLQTYLRFTIEAARNPQIYTNSQAAVAAIGEHALIIPNGTRGVVEEVKSFDYGGREDIQVRVMVQDGNLRGGEVWTTAGELVDSTGKNYLKT
jgi:hypothetical protein